MNETVSALRNVPSVDELLRTSIGGEIAKESGDAHTVSLVRAVLSDLRQMLVHGDASSERVDLTMSAVEMMTTRWNAERSRGIKRVINATGVIIHTNLGRAPLSEAALAAISNEAAGYCTLEYDLVTGRRGRRGRSVEELLVELTGAGDALVVNNCAAAAFFVLTVFAAGGEVIISRGELVEIGGDFRVPDVLSQSGAMLREVGTTNRTKLKDYEAAVVPATRLILRVHPSNFRIIGFTAAPSVEELAEFAHKKDLVIYEDLGSGALTDLSNVGLAGEPMVKASLESGVDVVTFSGDKLVGGPQAGIIVGKAELIERLRQHPLYRALRVDKLMNAALEATLLSYRRGTAAADVPVQRMLQMTANEINRRAQRLATQIDTAEIKVEIVDGTSAVGGGAAPHFQPPTRLLALTHPTVSAAEIERRLRHSSPPVIARIVDERVMLDLRTVAEADEDELISVVRKIG